MKAYHHILVESNRKWFIIMSLIHVIFVQSNITYTCLGGQEYYTKFIYYYK